MEEIGLLDEVKVVKFPLESDAEQLAEMLRELDWKEAQTVFAEVTARMCLAKTTDPQLCNESSEARKRLFALFEANWRAGDKLLFRAFQSYTFRLTTHHRWES